jgi:hypothetical protein
MLDGPRPDVESTAPELPTVESGVTLLETERPATGPLGSLALDHALTGGGPVVWVDSSGEARTTDLSRLAPSRRLLDRIHVARGFTAPQYVSLIQSVLNTVGPRRPPGDAGAPPHDPGLVVLPSLDAQLRESEVAGVADTEFRTSVLTMVRALATDFDVPVLMTRTRDDEFTEPVAAVAENVVRCEQTQFGPRFVGADFETLVYPDDHGFQTTLSWWRRVVAERAAAVATEPGVTVRG